MGFARYGIDKMVFCAKGTMLTSPTHVIAGGLRGKTKLTFEDVGDNEESRERFMHRGVLVTLDETPLYQPNLLNLMNIITQYLPDGGADAEITARPQSAGVDGGCFQFSGVAGPGAGELAKHLGIGFKYELSKRKRALSISARVEIRPNEASVLIDAADSNTPATFSTVTNAGINFTKRRNPWLSLTSHLGNTHEDIEDYSFILESVKDKENDLRDREISQMVRATLMYKFKSATVANMVTEMAEAEGVAMTFQEYTPPGILTFEKFVFNANVLTSQNTKVIGDDERNMTLKYSGLIPIGNISASYTTANGGGETETGADGGTITFAN